MSLVKLTMIETETAIEGEDDAVTVNAQTAETYIEVSSIRSIHARKLEDGIRRDGTRIAFLNGSQFAVTESPAQVAALLGYVAPSAIN